MDERGLLQYHHGYKTLCDSAPLLSQMGECGGIYIADSPGDSKVPPLDSFLRVQVFVSIFGGYYKTIFLRIVMVSCLHPVVIVRMKKHACLQVAKSESV